MGCWEENKKIEEEIKIKLEYILSDYCAGIGRDNEGYQKNGGGNNALLHKLLTKHVFKTDVGNLSGMGSCSFHDWMKGTKSSGWKMRGRNYSA